MRRHHNSRRGVAVIEFALVALPTLMLLLGILVGSMGIFRYQQMAHLAREASRWASVHGGQYARETGNAAATSTDVYQQSIVNHAAALNLSRLTYSVTWSTDNNPYHTIILNNKVVAVTNTVTVTINYQWIPEAFFGGTTLRSTSVSPMHY